MVPFESRSIRVLGLNLRRICILLLLFSVSFKFCRWHVENIPIFLLASSKGNPPLSTLYVFTYSNAYYTYVCEYLRSSISYGLKPLILGWNSTWNGPMDKLVGVMEALQSLPSRDIVLFTDAHDVVICGSNTSLVSRFIEFDADVVFSSEKSCWPMESKENGTYFCKDLYPASPTPYRYLNAGGLIGYVGSILELFRVLEGRIKEAPAGNEQELLSTAFMRGELGGRVKLDYFARIFQSLHLSEFPNSEEESRGDDMELVGKCRMRNKITGEHPLVMHFNGDGKYREQNFHTMLPNLEPEILDTCVGTHWDSRKAKVSNCTILRHLCCAKEWTNFYSNKRSPKWANCS